MRRDQLEHVLRTAKGVTGEREFVVIGSQAVLGTVATPPPEIAASLDVDVYPRHRSDLADDIDGAIGELSPFHELHGYYGHGVGPETACLPEGWDERLVRVENENTNGAIGWCLEPHDLVVSKLVASREKDLAFARACVLHGIVDVEMLVARIDALPIDASRRERLADFAATLRS